MFRQCTDVPQHSTMVLEQANQRSKGWCQQPRKGKVGAVKVGRTSLKFIISDL